MSYFLRVLDIDPFQALGLQGLSDDETLLQLQVVQALEARLERRLRAVLSEKEGRVLAAIRGSDDEVLHFLQSRIDDLDVLTRRVIDDLKTDLEWWERAQARADNRWPRGLDKNY